MTDRVLTDYDAQNSREQWFRYLDVVEPVRGELHSYCQRLTHSIWDAEDLVQDTLLKGFAMTARGDLHGEHSPVRNAKAYLFRTATNQWLDQQRKARREILCAQIEIEAEPGSNDIKPALEKALQLSSPQEFAALLLKEGFDFTLDEIADFVGTSVGTVKSSLSRGRRKMASENNALAVDADNRQLAKQFAAAINAQDLESLLALMADSLSIIVCNVGGGRGKSGIWTEQSVRLASARYAEFEGEAVVLLFDKTGAANDVVRIEASGGEVTRLTDYCYAPETLRYVARGLDTEIETKGYHQPPETLVNMIATTALPWRTTQD